MASQYFSSPMSRCAFANSCAAFCSSMAGSGGAGLIAGSGFGGSGRGAPRRGGNAVS